MDLLIRNARIINSGSPHHGKTTDLLIKNGAITAIGEALSNTENLKELSLKNLHVSAGFCDLFCDFASPGFEHRETLQTGANAAASGGFTKVFLIPNTHPALDNAAAVDALLHQSKGLPVEIVAHGAITKNAEGKDLTEMYEMAEHGVKAFTDGNKSVQSPGILLKALQYISAIPAIIIQVPNTKDIAAHGLMNESISSTQLGLPGKPALAEELMVMRDIELARYTKAPLHLTGISTQKSVELIAAAKKEGLRITCSVTPHHLIFTDEDLSGYDTNLKVINPFRSKADRNALIDGLQSGIIDCVATHHSPQHNDNKDCEFEYAKSGMIGLETCFPILNQMLGAEKSVEILTSKSRNVVGENEVTIKEGAIANLCFFDPEKTFVYQRNKTKSKSTNSPFYEKTLKGKVYGTYLNQNLFLNEME